MRLTARILLVLIVLISINTLMYIAWQGHTPWQKIPRSFLAANPLTYQPVSLNVSKEALEEEEPVYIEDFLNTDSLTGSETEPWETDTPTPPQKVKITESNLRKQATPKAPLSVERCQKILTKLWDRQGGKNMPSIRIANIAQYGKPAEYNSQRQEIVIDPRAYQLCLNVSNQKDDALAFLIAHELVHSYQHNESSYSSPGFFVKSGDLKSWARAQQEKRKNMESQADVWGAILCYLCGYKVDHIIPDFIENLYTSFNLAEEDPLYDSKKERMEIALRAQKRAKKSIEMYDMANYLTLLQEYDKAIYIYDFLIEEFKSAEFYNNRGLAYTRIGMSKLGEPYSLLPYPFLLDTETQLDKVGAKGRRTPADYLREAIENYNQAIALNDVYPAAKLNRAITWHLLSGAEELRRDQHIAQAKKDLIAVYGLKSTDEGLGSTHLATIKSGARKVATFIALKDEDLIRHTTRNFRPLSAADHPAIVDKVDFTSTYVFNSLSFDWDENLSNQERAIVSGKKLKNSFVSILETHNDIFYLQKVDKYVAALTTRSTGDLAQVGNYIPASMKDRLRKSLKDPYGNYFMVDDLKGVVYKVAPNGKVLEWVIFGE